MTWVEPALPTSAPDTHIMPDSSDLRVDDADDLAVQGVVRVPSTFDECLAKEQGELGVAVVRQA